MSLFSNKKWNKLAVIIAIAVTAVGVALRLWVYLQGRDLIIDESNIVRNIHSRGFIDLLNPLDYEQYAPPVFLWETKIASIIFGFAEWGLKLYPLICGIASCFVFYKLLEKLLPKATMWYPVALFALTPILIRYASELKQYSSDVFITLLLLLLALSIDIKKTKAIKFIAIWVVVGVVAIFSSMPSVFILAGIGCYYGWDAICNKQYGKITVIAAASITWVGFFAMYYFAILEPQANSKYLQDFHHYHFLFATPSKQEEWNHNLYVFYGLMYVFEGIDNYAHDINKVLLLVGAISLFIKERSKFFLIIVPLLCLFAAAAMDKFSLLPRVSLFSIPILIIIIGVGFQQLFKIKYVAVKILTVACGVYALSCTANLLMKEEFKYEQITEGMQFLIDKGLRDDKISVYHSAVPAFKYYTEIHPDKDKWESIKQADLLQWYINYDSLGWFMQNIWSTVEPKGFLYTNTTAKDLEKRDGGINKHLKRLDSLVTPQVQAYVYIKHTTTE